MSRRRIDGARVLVTGGAGFIGSHLVQRLLETPADVTVTTLDVLTYAGRRENLAAVADDPRHRLVVGDVADSAAVVPLVAEADIVCHLAAETHVDRSIEEGVRFVQTDAVGTAVLLEAVRRHPVSLFLHISTDEVYGEVAEGRAGEDQPLRPRNPYSASKAAADHLASAYHQTHGVPTIVVRPANQYGPRQYPEKLIPLFTINALEGRPLPLYGDGRQRREWTHVDDGVAALLLLLEAGEPGNVYNIGSGDEHENIEVARGICDAAGADASLITTVADRPGHDRRYAMDCSRLRALGWQPRVPFAAGLRDTVAWYRRHRSWWEPIVHASPSYRRWISSQYSGISQPGGRSADANDAQPPSQPPRE